MVSDHRFCQAMLRRTREDLTESQRKIDKGIFIETTVTAAGKRWHYVHKKSGALIWEGTACCKYTARMKALDRLIEDSLSMPPTRAPEIYAMYSGPTTSKDIVKKAARPICSFCGKQIRGKLINCYTYTLGYSSVEYCLTSCTDHTLEFDTLIDAMTWPTPDPENINITPVRMKVIEPRTYSRNKSELINLYDRTGALDKLAKHYARKICKDWKWIQLHRTLNAQDPDARLHCDFTDEPTQWYGIYIGKVYDHAPSGKYWMPWASNQTVKDELKDEVFFSVFQSILQGQDLYLHYGDGDPTDMYIIKEFAQDTDLDPKARPLRAQYLTK